MIFAVTKIMDQKNLPFCVDSHLVQRRMSGFLSLPKTAVSTVFEPQISSVIFDAISLLKQDAG